VGDAQAQSLTNSHFEEPVLAAYVLYNPPIDIEQAWTFTGYCGLAKDGGSANSTFPVADTNFPGQYAFLQLWQTAGSAFSQPVSFPAPGAFRLIYHEAGRQLCPSGAGGDLRYKVCVSDKSSGVEVLCMTNQTSTDQGFLRRIGTFVITHPGLYELSFRTLEHTGPYNDNATLIDTVFVVPISVSLSLFEVGHNIRLEWNSESNDIFHVQERTTLKDGDWLSIGSAIHSTASVTSVLLPLDPQSKTRFFHVQMDLP
jgi:hypothetical protein